jgi:hypothetical protein
MSCCFFSITVVIFYREIDSLDETIMTYELLAPQASAGR